MLRLCGARRGFLTLAVEPARAAALRGSRLGWVDEQLRSGQRLSEQFTHEINQTLSQATSTEARVLHGIILHRRLLGERNLPRAQELFQEAAQRGDALGAYHSGVLYETGGDLSAEHFANDGLWIRNTAADVSPLVFPPPESEALYDRFWAATWTYVEVAAEHINHSPKTPLLNPPIPRPLAHLAPPLRPVDLEKAADMYQQSMIAGYKPAAVRLARVAAVLCNDFVAGQRILQDAANKGSDIARLALSVGALLRSRYPYDALNEHILPVAKRGNADAMAMASQVYRLFSDNKSHNHEVLARKWEQAAAEAGSGEACLAQFNHLVWEMETSSSARTAENARRSQGFLLRAALEENHVASLVVLATALRDGSKGFTDDPARALYLFERAGWQGSSKALVCAGDMHYFGKGTSVDYGKARQTYQEASRMNDRGAWQRLTALYHKGKGVEKNEDLACVYSKQLKQPYPPREGAAVEVSCAR